MDFSPRIGEKSDVLLKHSSFQYLTPILLMQMYKCTRVISIFRRRSTAMLLVLFLNIILLVIPLSLVSMEQHGREPKCAITHSEPILAFGIRCYENDSVGRMESIINLLRSAQQNQENFEFNNVDLEDIPRNFVLLFPQVVKVTILHESEQSYRSSVLSNSLLYKLKRVKELNIKRTGIVKIEEDAFKEFMSLVRLSLSFNSISIIPAQFPRQLPLLEILRLSNNMLTSESVNVISQLRYLKLLDLSYNLIDHLAAPNSGYFYYLEELYIVGNPIKSVYKMESFKNLRYLHITYLANVTDLFSRKDQYSRLYKFIFTNGSAIAFDTNLLAAAPRLQNLEITRNQLESIPAGNQQTKENIKKFSLAYNQITFIHENDFDDWTSLIRLYLQWNRINGFNKNAFSKLRRLRFIFLDYNQIKTIDPDSLRNNRILEMFSISYNQVNHIHPNLFRNTGKLQYVDLSGNRIRDLVARNPLACSIAYVALRGNKISTVTFSRTKSYKTLANFGLDSEFVPHSILTALKIYGQNATKVFSLTNKNLTTFREINMFVAVNILISLDVTNNQITMLEPTDFSGVVNLKYLSLQSNIITKIKSKAFEAAGHLEAIDLGQNKLSTIPVDAFDGLENLIFFNLADNKLKSIPGSLYDLKMPNLVFLNVSNNQVQNFNIEHFAMMRSLGQIVVEGMKIEAIFYY
ncbi:hypothetical protein ACOME3_006245 [Neoechinorhynchus agilis]